MVKGYKLQSNVMMEIKYKMMGVLVYVKQRMIGYEKEEIKYKQTNVLVNLEMNMEYLVKLGKRFILHIIKDCH